MNTSARHTVPVHARRRALRATFDLGAPLYGWATAQHVWQENGARMAMHLPPRPAPHVLDLGAGPGISIIGMATVRPDAIYVALDIAPAMLREAGRRLRNTGQRAPLLCADGAHLPIADQSFDAVTGHSFLYLVDDASSVLAETRRVLRPGGRAIFMEPRHGRVAWRHLLRAHWKDGRYLLTMAAWRLFSSLEGRYTAQRFQREAEQVGLHYHYTLTLLDGLGLLCVAGRDASCAPA